MARHHNLLSIPSALGGPLSRGWIGAAHGAYGGFSPSALFAASEQGAWYDPSDLSSMYQDAAGTTPAVVGQPVGRIEDKSGRGNHATQSTTASKPILRQSGDLYYLEFDGADDFLVTGSINFTATDEVSVFAGVRKLTSSPAGMVAELGANSDTTNSSFALAVNILSDNLQIRSYSRGTTLSTANTGSGQYLGDQLRAVTTLAEISSDTNLLRVDGAQVVSSVADQGTGNYQNAPFYIGRRGGNAVPFNGRLYSLIVRGKLTSGDNLTNTEAYVAGKTGVVL